MISCVSNVVSLSYDQTVSTVSCSSSGSHPIKIEIDGNERYTVFPLCGLYSMRSQHIQWYDQRSPIIDLIWPQNDDKSRRRHTKHVERQINKKLIQIKQVQPKPIRRKWEKWEAQLYSSNLNRKSYASMRNDKQAPLSGTLLEIACCATATINGYQNYFSVSEKFLRMCLFCFFFLHTTNKSPSPPPSHNLFTHTVRLITK